MRIRVGGAMRQTGEAFPFSLSETPEPVLYGERALTFSEPVSVQGTYVYDGKAFTVAASVSAALDAVCARCTKPFIERISFSFSERFVKEAGEAADDETYLYTGDELDVEKAVMDNLLLELPIADVCREVCKGLCPICGSDRNATNCACIVNEA